jgi:hypothetical protein
MKQKEQAEAFRIRALAFEACPFEQVDILARAVEHEGSDFDPETDILTLMAREGGVRLKLVKHGFIHFGNVL